jgi:hypothetical protein
MCSFPPDDHLMEIICFVRVKAVLGIRPVRQTVSMPFRSVPLIS